MHSEDETSPQGYMYHDTPVDTAQKISYPSGNLGVYATPAGVEVRVFAGRAIRVDFCHIYKESNPKNTENTKNTKSLDPTHSQIRESRWQIHRETNGNWSGFIPGLKPGDTYGFRVHGAWDPATGQFHNPAKLLLDPYARGLEGSIVYCPAIYAHKVDENIKPLGDNWEINLLDSAPFVPWSVVIDDSFPPIAPRPKLGRDQAIIYEAHVRGFTMQLPNLPEELRGTYAGMAHPATVSYLKNLGVTTIELLPIHANATEAFLDKKGLKNYWGYNTLGYFSPEPSYATKHAQAEGAGAVLNEVKGMVSILHQAGFEVIIDVVYNHTCESGLDGPSLSWRGLDNVAYYLNAPGKVDYLDTTGCGNSIDFRHRNVMQMTIDSLRYWVEQVGVDGFRFDLAVTLGRHREEFSSIHPMLTMITLDPVLRNSRIIAEPWDLGPNGWRTGDFPPHFSDWNDHFRDTCRSIWVTDRAQLHNGQGVGDLRELATRLSGSADLFAHGELPGGRGPVASVNYITAHDGFTLADLVSYNEKHNLANLENNQDGTSNNRSWNHGLEGPTQDPNIALQRQQSMLNLLGTLLISAGLPMITAGDEFGRTQTGNNNAYCQDTEISWVNWDLNPWQKEQLDATSSLIHLRRQHPVLRPPVFASGTPATGDEIPDLAWFSATGAPMTNYDWHDSNCRQIQMLRSGKPYNDQDLLLLLNTGDKECEFYLVDNHTGQWEYVWSSHIKAYRDTKDKYLAAGNLLTLAPFSFHIFLSR